MYPWSSSLLLEDRGIDGHSSFKQASLLPLTLNFVEVTSTTTTTTLNTANPCRKPQHKLKLPSPSSRPLHLVIVTGPLAFLSKFASKCRPRGKHASKCINSCMQRAPTSLRDGWNTNLFDHFSYDWQLHVFPQAPAEFGDHLGEHACHLTKTGTTTMS